MIFLLLVLGAMDEFFASCFRGPWMSFLLLVLGAMDEFLFLVLGDHR